MKFYLTNNLNKITKHIPISFPRNIDDYDDSNYASVHQNQTISEVHKFNSFTENSSLQQSFKPMPKKVDFFKLKVQEQIAKNLLSDDKEESSRYHPNKKHHPQEEIK